MPIDADDVPPMDSDQQDRTPSTVTRDGSRAWVDTPLDSPYAERLRRFRANWDPDTARWWVGIAKAAALEHLLSLPLSDETYSSFFTPPKPGAQPHTPSSTAMPACARVCHILNKVAEEVCKRGLVGEKRLAKTLYLVLTSRLLEDQVSAGVKGHSASGKSKTVEIVTRFFPPEAYLEFTAMSERALIYSTDEYSYRTLIVYEITALREGVEDDMTSYFVRTLLSEGKIVYPVTVRGEDGGFVTKTITKEGPTNLIFTTTKTRVHAENETRILSLATDDSREQTARVLLELADESNDGGDLREWWDLQRWLASADHRVTIPYARQLAQLVPPVAVRLRRDFGSFLALIRAHAMLHQASRARDDAGSIIATLDDYAVVRDLVAGAISEGVGQTVPDTVRETVAAVEALASDKGVMVRAIAERLRLDRSTVARRLLMASDGGYLRNLEDKRGKPGRWVIGDSLPDSVDLLPDPSHMRTAETTAEQVVCSCAPESKEESGKAETPADQGVCSCAPESEGENDNIFSDEPSPNGQAPRCACGEELIQPESIRRGTCAECFLTGKREAPAVNFHRPLWETEP